MMKRIAGSLTLILILLMASALILFPQMTVTGAQTGLMICAHAIIPALFPFFVITNMLCALGYTEKFGGSYLLFSLIGGYPVGVQTIANQYRSGIIRKEDAQRLILYCNNAGPAFIFGVVGHRLFKSFWAGLALYLIHAASAFILGKTIFRGNSTKTGIQPDMAEKPAFSKALTLSIRQAGMTAIHVCIFVVFFSILSTYLRSFLPDQWRHDRMIRFLLGCLELAGGIEVLSEIPNQALSFCLAAFLLGFGGLCVTLQTFSILDDTDLSGKYYLPAKMIHGLLSFVLAVPISALLKLDGVIGINPYYPLFLLFPASIPFILRFAKKSSGNTKYNEV